MKILIYGLNHAPELTGIGKYTGEMVAELVAQGHECRVVTSIPYYPHWKIQTGYKNFYQVEERDGAQVFRCPLWVPRKGGAFVRIVHLMSFVLSSIPALCRQKSWKPDVLICVVPTMFSSPLAWLASRWFGCLSCLHVQDIELDAMINLFFSSDKKNSRWVRMTKKIDAWFMNRHDLISSISHRMCEHLEQHCGRELIFFPNWVDLKKIEPNQDQSVNYRELWQVTDEQFFVLYSGNLGKKQNLDLLLDVASELKADSEIKFIVVGEGVLKSHLAERIDREKLQNVSLHPLQPYEQLGNLLRSANLHLVLQSSDVEDLVMPSKLTSILAVGGTTLLTAHENTELGRLLEKSPGLGYLVTPDHRAALKHAILKAKSGWKQKGKTTNENEVAKEYAKEHLDRHQVIGSFAKVLEKSCSAKD
jgi:colanic acid biosynthesis glycosyl transferase WcaI